MLIFLSLIGAVLTAPPPAGAQAPPPSIQLDGPVTVTLAAQARRVHLLGSLEFYRLAIYTNGSAVDIGTLSSIDTPKALRIDVTYKHDLHRTITFDWQRELVPGLEAAAVAQLRRVFAALREGDAVQIEYTRDRGTTVRINRDVAVMRGSHEVMLAFLDHWIGQRPISEELKQALLR